MELANQSHVQRAKLSKIKKIRVMSSRICLILSLFLLPIQTSAESKGIGLVLKKVVENIHMNRDKHKMSCISAFPKKESDYSVRVYRDGTKLAFENQGEAGFYCGKKTLEELYRLSSCLRPKIKAFSKYSLDLQRRSRSIESPLRHYIQIKNTKRESLFQKFVDNFGARKAIAAEAQCSYEVSLVEVFSNEKERILLSNEDLQTEGTYCLSCQR